MAKVKSRRISGDAWCVAAISLLYWFCAGSRAVSRLFWYDELLTWHVARLPTVAMIWSALHAPVDQQLPLCYLAVRLSHATFGYGTLATRLPALVGFWVMSLCLYFFLKRRLPGPYALIGMVFPMLTFAWDYAFEARGYGIVLGGAGLALISWQAATEGRVRPLALCGIATGLALALASNFTAVLLAIPFVLGEGVRTVSRRKLDLPVWAAFATAASVTLIYPGLLSATHEWNVTGMEPNFGSLAKVYVTALTSAITPLVLAAIAAYVFTRAPKLPPETPGLPSHETAVFIGFTLAPVPLIAARLVTHHLMFYPRYGLVCVIGMAGLLALLMFKTTSGNRRAGIAALLILVGWFCAARGREVRIHSRDHRQQFEEQNPVLVRAINDGLPVVVPDPLIVMEADFYLAPPATERIYYPTSVEDRGPRDTLNRLMSAAARYLPIRPRVDSWPSLASTHQPFLLYTNEVLQQSAYDFLRQGGWRLTLRVREGAESLFEVAPAR